MKRICSILLLIIGWDDIKNQGGEMGKNLDFTEGPIKSNLIKFAIPLFLGNLFQQLYNAADSLIVGNFLGPQALAAVSSSSPLIFMMVGFFNGVAIGAGVVISKSFGARNWPSLEKAVHTDLAFGIASGMFLTVFGIIFTPHILHLMKTPEDIMPNSIIYFRIYSMGILFSVMYNICMGIMNAVGDSRHPLYYLIISSVINVICDILFVGVFGFGVGAAAFATILSQAVSTILCMVKLTRTEAFYRVSLKRIRFDLPILKQIIRYGLPAGIQNSVIGFANTVVQTNINTFSSVAVAGSGAYSKIEGFAFLPVTCFSLGLTTFIGQNLGAGKYDRAKKGARFAILCSMSLAELLGIAFFVSAPFLIALFNNDPQVVAYGTRQAHIESLFYCFLALSHCIAGILRGAGKASIPMLIMFGSWCLLRVTYITAALSFIHEIEIIYSAYPLTWSVSSILFIIYLKKADWLHSLDPKEGK